MEECRKLEAEEEAQAGVDIWKYAFGFVDMAVVKCAIELGIPDTLVNQDKPMTLSEISAALRCSPPQLYRIMRYLVHRKIVKEVASTATDGSIGYISTPLSRRMTSHGDGTLAPLILLESSPVMLAPWLNLSARVLLEGENTRSPFERANDEEIWQYAAKNPGHSELINEAMACDARLVVPAIVKGCPEVFEGVENVVDVGGGNGTALGLLVKAFPWVKGINFDLPHVVSVANKYDGVENVGGDMFKSVPKADAAFTMWVLHDWNDEYCIRILEKCKEAIRGEEKCGKMIIVDAVVEEKKDEEVELVRLMLDMVMVAHTNNGKERTLKEWEYVLTEAGFSSFKVKHIEAVQSVIEAYP
ncbi:(RS)-norcoclaurine 6-O-methyltransferase-like [Carica papaya]|uniref:(RS)-norcoclaurine 6-O-methyltransferase-like n=1 Tax=Carica papaya TaxID=3649 RepID=UPI000B8CFBD9|nr:(RS)-norcoclaurine 6-O-methyltransferase-like [Carica papaya]